MKPTLFSTIFIIVITAAGCSFDPGKRKVVPSNILVEKVPENEENCEEPLADQYRLFNKGAGNGRILVKIIERSLNGDGSDTTSSPAKLYFVKSGERVALPCTVYRKNDILIQRAFLINDIHYPAAAEVAGNLTISKLVRGNLKPVPEDLNPTDECLKKYLASDTSMTVFDATNSSDKPKGLAIAKMLNNLKPNDTIPIKKIIDFVKGKKIDGIRSDVAFVNGTAYNYGDSLEARGTLPPGSGKLSIIIPSNLMFKYTKDGVGGFTFAFKKSQGAPRLVFTDNVLQASLGGHIQRIDFHQNAYVVQTEKGCFAVKLK